VTELDCEAFRSDRDDQLLDHAPMLLILLVDQPGGLVVKLGNDGEVGVSLTHAEVTAVRIRPHIGQPRGQLGEAALDRINLLVARPRLEPEYHDVAEHQPPRC
jgi:hypothetical protein